MKYVINIHLDHMLNNDRLAEKFYGCTVYKGFLYPANYHRWHSPISGRIFKTELVDGSYYSQPYYIQPDPVLRRNSKSISPMSQLEVSSISKLIILKLL